MNTLKRARALVRTVNNLFISMILTVFYFTLFGLVAVGYKLAQLFPKKPTGSYWLDAPKATPPRDYYTTPY